jgi:hypothetical protein
MYQAFPLNLLHKTEYRPIKSIWNLFLLLSALFCGCKYRALVGLSTLFYSKKREREIK